MARYESRKKHRDWVKVRLRCIAVLMFLVLASLWARAYQIQVMRGPELAELANRQYWASEELRAERGEIKDREGRLLAKTVTVQSVYARPLEIEDPAATAQRVAEALELPVREVREIISRPKPFVWVKRKVTDHAAAKIRGAGLPGIHLTAENQRFYPQGHVAGQLLGFVGMDGQGLEGLELSFDSLLSGRGAKNVVQKDAAGHRLFASGQHVSGIAGQDLQLTIDANLQFAAEEILAEAVQTHKGRWGVSLLVEVASGDILAWACYPFFDPNSFKSATPEKWRNRVVLDEMEPGSTMKPLLIAAALEEGVCDRDSIYFCENGKWRHAGVTINDTHEYCWLPVHKILRYSSNIGAAKIGLSLGAETYYKYLKSLGVAEATALPVPGENPGRMRPPQTWTDVDLAASSFGQSLSMNAAQLARAYLCLAGKGVLKPLRLVTVPETPLPEDRRVFSTGTAVETLRMLSEVVEENGTGTQARIEGVMVGGKTGTAQKASPKGGYGDTYTATFVGLVPALEPEYLILVMVDEPTTNHYGGVVAAPAVRDIAVTTLAYFGALPGTRAGLEGLAELSTRPGSPGPSSRSRVLRPQNVPTGDSVPELRGMSLRQALGVLAGRGVFPRLEGEGTVVVRQEPSPGAPAASQSKNWTLWLGLPSDTA